MSEDAGSLRCPPPAPAEVANSVQAMGAISTNIQPDIMKKYFKLLQAIHHAEIINKSLKHSIFPKGMLNRVEKMARFIKPASPYLETSNKIKENTDLWVKTNFYILRDNYDQLISTTLPTLPDFHLEKWARARYGRKLTFSSIDTLRSMIMPTYNKPP